MTSATVKQMTWGEIVMEDGETFKDVMLAPDLVKSWDWRVSGTSHSKGIQKSDIDVLLAQGIDALVLSRGVDLKLTVSKETKAYAELKVKIVVVDQSERAVEKYNQLAKSGVRVGALIHSTC